MGSGAGEFRGAAAGAEAAAGAPLRSAPAPVARDGHTNASRRWGEFCFVRMLPCWVWRGKSSLEIVSHACRREG